MTRRALAAVAPFVLLVGCADGQRIRLAPPGPFTETTSLRCYGSRHVPSAPATEETARRVLLVARRIVDANSQTGLRPMVLTVGAPHVEIFHQGGGAESLRIYVTEGLVKRCKDDAQLAAVLCHELGKVACERQALAGPEDRPAGEFRRTQATVGNDAGGSFGPPDGTRLLEEGKKERQRRQKTPAPTPEALARRYLARADFPPEALTAVGPLLREAEQTYIVEKHLQPPEEPVRLLPAEPSAQPVWRTGDPSALR